MSCIKSFHNDFKAVDMDMKHEILRLRFLSRVI